MPIRNALPANACSGLTLFALALAILLPLTLPAIGHAQPASSQAQQKQEYQIPAGTLEQTLSTLGRQAGIVLMFSSELVSGKSSDGLNGLFTPGQALERLLSGTGLVATPQSGGGYSIALEQKGVMTLPSVKVNADTIQESAFGPIDGYVAKHSATGTKTDTPIIETPQSISVVSRKEMDDRNVRDIGEAVAYTSGVAIGSTGETTLFGGNNVRVRGFGGSGTAGASFNEYLDGLKLRGSGFVSANLDPWLFERVEVLKGPASVLFGQTQPGGIVNMVSKRPHTDMTNKIRMGTGNFDHANVAFDLGGEISDELLFRVVGLGLTGDTQQDHSDRKRQVLAPSLAWSNGTTELTLLAHYQRDDINASILSIVPRDGVFANPNGRVPTSFRVGDPGFEYWDRETWATGYLFSHRFNEDLIFRQNLRLTDNKLESNWLYRRSLEADQRTLQRSAFSARENSNDLTIDNQLELKFGSGDMHHTVLAGIDYHQLENDGLRGFGAAGVPSIDLFNPVYNQAIPNPPIYQDNENKLEQLGFYLQDQIKIGALSVLLGGRYDQAETTTKNNLTSTTTRVSDYDFTGRVGIIYNFANGFAPYVSYSESFEPVSGTAFDGSQFEPMKGKQVEVGVKYQPSGTEHLMTVAAFELTQENMTTTDPDNIGFNIQTGEVQTRGLELEGKFSVNESLNMTVAYTHLDDEVTKSNNGDQGNRRVQLPRQTASIWANYSIPSGALSGIGLGMGVRYMGETEGDNGNTFSVPDYTLVDFAIYYDLEQSPFGLKGWNANLNINNLFDKYYIASCFASHSCYLGQERSIRAAVEYSW